ncbi:MAG: hypothetical protein F4213_08345 [Boseongicola sp. SB0677_bin_26]|nr:hypothetical protein [Boseongicola sp. SB0677_bin_26]
MNDDEDGKAAGHSDEALRGEAWNAEPAPQGAHWLQRHRVTLPDPVEGWLDRGDLEARCVLTDRRLTVLHAPGGFGKTALLGHCCRTLRGEGVAVAWLSLDEEDVPDRLAAHLALAFDAIGLGACGDGAGGDAGTRAPGSRTDTQADWRISLLVRSLERHEAPCALALDDVERIAANPGAVRTINALLRRAPRNLHVGMAFREPPPGLEIAMFALDGREVTVTADELRFSRPEIARFFGQGLSRRELASVAVESAGWPIALRIRRNAGRLESGLALGAERTAAGWIETRLWRGVRIEDRDFLLDAALFDGLDAELVDEVLGVRSSERRLASMGALAGLLSTRGGGTGVRFHPLVRAWCERRRFSESPDRFRKVRGGIARALARRGRWVEALRHAGETGDAALLGEIGERAGGVRLWLEHGVEALRAVDGLLSQEVLERHPRLALVRCVALTLSGDIAAAKRVYGAAEAGTAGFTRDREGGDDEALLIDCMLVYGLVGMCGCAPYGEVSARMLPLGAGMVEGGDTGMPFRGVFSLGLCLAHNQGAGFDAAVEWGECARSALGRGSPYLAHVDFQLGSVAMARGRADEAQAFYGRALGVARASHLRDAGAMVLGNVLAAELESERSAGAAAADGCRVSPRLLGECGAWLDIYAASADVGTELELLRGDPSAALALVEDARDFARHTGRAPLVRFLSALRVSVLLARGDVGEAERAWRFDRLPDGPGECTDLSAQSWREAETIACARLRLLVARGAFEAARDLSGTLDAVAAERGMARTRMRGLALAMVLEHRAGDDARARERLAEGLRLLEETGYARPLVREGAVALALLDGAGPARESIAGAAGRLRAAIAGETSARASAARLTDHELEVLALMERYWDKEIARRLDLSFYDVRYRIGSIFAKLGARGRIDAVHRARERGLLPPVGTERRSVRAP